MVPPSAGSSVMVMVDSPGAGSDSPSSQPHVKTSRLPGSTSTIVPDALAPGTTVHL